MLVELPTKECAKITCARGLRRLATGSRASSQGASRRAGVPV